MRCVPSTLMRWITPCPGGAGASVTGGATWSSVISVAGGTGAIGCGIDGAASSGGGGGGGMAGACAHDTGAHKTTTNEKATAQATTSRTLRAKGWPFKVIESPCDKRAASLGGARKRH